jgi:hypothetical protein
VQDTTYCPVGTQWCYSGTCVQCLSNTDCSSGMTCNSSHTCVSCRRTPSAGNLISNPGFDTGLTSWNVNTATWDSLYDADGCASSGSAYGSFLWEDPWQCVQIPAHSGSVTYHFGAMFYVGGTVNGAQCRVEYFSDSACTNYSVSDSYPMGPQAQNMTIGWLSYDVVTTAPANARSAFVACASEDSPPNIDKIYLNASGTF